MFLNCIVPVYCLFCQSQAQLFFWETGLAFHKYFWWFTIPLLQRHPCEKRKLHSSLCKFFPVILVAGGRNSRVEADHPSDEDDSKVLNGIKRSTPVSLTCFLPAERTCQKRRPMALTSPDHMKPGATTINHLSEQRLCILPISSWALSGPEIMSWADFYVLRMVTCVAAVEWIVDGIR